MDRRRPRRHAPIFEGKSRPAGRRRSILGPLLRAGAGVRLHFARIDGFAAFRFLYERLVGAEARPWFPAAFCAAAAMPHLQPERRKLLLQSISEAVATAPGWSKRAPRFFPEWVEKVDATVAR